MEKAIHIFKRKSTAKTKRSPKYRKVDFVRAFFQEEKKGYSVIAQTGGEVILPNVLRTAGISCVDRSEGRKPALVQVKVRSAGKPRGKVARVTQISNGNVAKRDTAAVLAEEISVNRFERSIGRMSKELKQSYSQKNLLSQAGVWNGEGADGKERLRSVSLADSILSPYQIKRK